MRSLTAVTLGLWLLGGAPVLASEAEEKAAVSAAESWLKLIDAGQAAASWDAAASSFKAAVDKPGWEKALRAARGPLGTLVSRKLVTRQLTHTLPGAPDGTYVVLTYQSQFEHKKSAVETVTPMLDTDGRWRVSGYFIR
jgi:Protein of unknown function (DUF4019)